MPRPRPSACRSSWLGFSRLRISISFLVESAALRFAGALVGAALPERSNRQHWMFQHPDGRRWIGYRAGTFIADRAIAASGRSAADLVRVSADDILRYAGLV